MRIMLFQVTVKTRILLLSFYTEVLEATDASLQDEEPDAFDDLHAVDVIESDDEEETSSRSGRLASFDFSNIKWSDKENVEHVQRGVFKQQIGPVTVLPIGASALHFFHLLFTMNILKAIVRENNKYAEQCLRSAGKDPHSFENVTEIELLAYLGLVIAMSLHPLHSIRDYWSTDWMLGVPTLARIMSRHEVYFDNFFFMLRTCRNFVFQQDHFMWHP